MQATTCLGVSGYRTLSPFFRLVPIHHGGQFATTTANILKFHRYQFSTIIPQDGINRVKPNDIRTMSTRGKAQERDFITVAIPGNYDNDKNRRGKLSLCRVRVLRILFQTVRHLRV